MDLVCQDLSDEGLFQQKIEKETKSMNSKIINLMRKRTVVHFHNVSSTACLKIIY